MTLLALSSGRAQAQPFPSYEHQERIPKTFGVIAFRNFALTSDDLFRPGGEGLPGDAALAAAQAYTQRWLATHEDVQLIADRELRDRIASSKAYREGILLAREWFTIGVDHYKELRSDRAVENLERATALYLDVFQDVVEPFALSESELFRALALSELKQDELAHVALKRMLLFDPWKRFRRGYYPPTTETALASALVDFRLTGTPELALLSLDRVDRLLRLTGLDGLLFGYLESTPEGGQALNIVLFEAGPARITFRDRVVLAQDNDEPDENEGLDRLLSRWAACATFRTPSKPKGPEHARVLFDVGFAESFPLLHPTRKLYHQVGLALGVAYQLTRGLDLFGHVLIATTMSDPDGDLLRASTSLRTTVGVGFTFRSHRIRWFIHPGIQIAAIPRLSWTTNPYCKLYAGFPADERSPLCRPEEISTLSSPVLAGIDLTVGFDVFLTNELFLGIKVGSSAYLVPFEATDDLNFPLLFQLGIGYAL